MCCCDVECSLCRGPSETVVASRAQHSKAQPSWMSAGCVRPASRATVDVIFGITVTAHSLLLGEVGVDVEILLRFERC